MAGVLGWREIRRVDIRDKVRELSRGQGRKKNSGFILSQSVFMRFKAGIAKCDSCTSSVSIIWELRNANSSAKL